jgi:alpha-L-rhamnosidase
MNSFNHYALGAVGDWLHRVVGGIVPGEPGYRCTEIRPRPGGVLTFARARHRTPYGAVECAWRVADGRMEVEVVVPPNASAEVTLPGTDREAIRVGSGKHTWSYPYRDPDARPPLSLDSTLGSLLDDAEAWTAVQAVLIRHVPDMANASGSMQGYSDLTLREVFGMIPGGFTELLREIEAALVETARNPAPAMGTE